jgi:nicotinate-nucleotide pyrophosphorylase (carboxylating)
MNFSRTIIRKLVEGALFEDLGRTGDVTAQATVPEDAVSSAKIISKQAGILCGVDLAVEVFRQMDSSAEIRVHARDRSSLKKGARILEVRAKTRSILSGERTALNFLQRLSGIATFTAEFVKKAKQGRSKVRVLDTRKTTPLLRHIEKYAVFCGGGTNHRMGLYDMVLIKDNHVAFLSKKSEHPVFDAVIQARQKWPKLQIEIECDRLDQVCEAIAAQANIILLDNMSLAEMRKAVKLVAGRAKTEASGNVNLKTIENIAKTGVDFISVGALTHSAPSLDLSLEME